MHSLAIAGKEGASRVRAPFRARLDRSREEISPMQLNFQNTAVGGFPFEVLRLMSTQGTHGAELGECLATARRIQPNNFASWTRAWSHLADRVALEAETALRKGHPITA